MQEYESGNTKNTMEFIKYLQKQRPGNKLAIFWDGETYHNSKVYREYLMTIDQNLS